MKKLITRSLTGAVYVALIVAGLLCGPWTFLALSLLLVVTAVTEFNRLTDAVAPRDRFLGLIDTLGAMVMVASACWIAVSDTCCGSFPVIAVAGMFYLIYMVIRLVAQLYSQAGGPIESLARSFMGQMYIAVPLSLMAFIYGRPGGEYIMLAIFIMIWLNDTGAFIVGSTLGRHRLWERMSPKKSWEGFFGGVIFAVASAFVFKGCFASSYPSLSLGAMLGLGALVGVFATWGDLIESMIKRALGVKDSGNILPGHGGILDRIDSLLLVVPAATIYLVLVNIF